jgi:chondroitin 4-sulfotransferase 11
MISHEHRCIFVHIPKTAGNSINRVFGVGWEDHKDLQRYSDELPSDVFAAYFKFAVVRNPWDRLLSDYNYQLKKSRAPASKLFVVDADGSKRNFAEWVEVALEEPNRYEAGDWGGAVSPHIHRWSPQIDWISIDGEPRTDFVARLERLPEDFRAICRRLDLPPVRLPHRNRRLHLHYSHYYNRTTRELVAAYYARDIEHFGYEFEHAFFRLAVNWPGARRTAEPAPQRSTDFQEPGDATDRAGKVSFATARPPVRRRIWQRRPGLTAVVSLALVLGSFSLSSLATPLTAEDAVAPPTPRQQFVRRIILRSAATPSGDSAASFFVRARRFSRLMSELNLSLEIVPAVAPGAIFSLSLEPTGDTRSYARSVAPVGNRSSSGPAPRWWWLRRNSVDED